MISPASRTILTLHRFPVTSADVWIVFALPSASIDQEAITTFLSHVRRSQAGRVDAARRSLGDLTQSPLAEAIARCAEALIRFIYTTVEQSRRRSLREMWLAARESTSDSDARFRARILDYLSQGDVAPVLERLVDLPSFGFGDWTALLRNVAPGEDGRELRGNTARLLASYPDHPGMLLARAMSEMLDDRGDLRELRSNPLSSLRSARAAYGVSADELLELGSWLRTIAKNRPAGLVGVIEALAEADAGREIVEEALAASFAVTGSDPGLRVVALAGTMAAANEHINAVLAGHEGGWG